MDRDLAKSMRCVAWASIVWLAACAGSAGSAQRAVPVASADPAMLYAQQCAFCHGADGGGDGVASPLLYPPARDFGQGMFRDRQHVERGADR